MRTVHKRLIGLAVVTALTLGTSTAIAAQRQVDVALEWFDTTVATINAAPAPTQVTNNRTWAIAWLAATKAVRATDNDAALAAAVHQTLTTLIPTRTTELDAALATTLAQIPNGTNKTRAVEAGKQQARAVLATRTGDGLDPASVNAPFPTPTPAPGIWQPTPPAFSPGAQAGNRAARPFLLRSADQYRPNPPPALDSQQYQDDLAEVRTYGAVDSTVRTQAQTDTATFWYGSSFTLYTAPVRAVLAQSRQPLGSRAALVALVHVALVDTQIATSDAKYAYLRWRPVTAIGGGWAPLHVTPAHPDYPSGHCTYAGAVEGVLTALVGPRTAEPFTITNPSAPGVTRDYTNWRQLTAENVDARVWSGIHTRTADTVGVDLGSQVASHILREAGRLFG
jgi:hypothetical protein